MLEERAVRREVQEGGGGSDRVASKRMVQRVRGCERRDAHHGDLYYYTDMR